MTTFASRFPTPLLDKARDVRVFFLDVDGVMTDGGLYFTSEGEVVKKFNSLDGHGLKLLKRSGIVPVVITGRDSQALRRRVAELSIDHAYYGVENKLLTAETCLHNLGKDWSQAAAMGDDWPDLPVLLHSRFTFAPPQAHTELQTRVDHVCSSVAGGGAVREACDLLMTANGYYKLALDEILS